MDYEKAFDRVDWRKVMEVLRKIGVDWRDRRLIGNLYMKQKVVIRIAEEESDAATIGRGVQQGCPLSPLLFNIFIEDLIREAMENIEEGITVGGQLITAIRFVDDQAMVASSAEGLQIIMDQLEQVSQQYEMKINVKKTKVLGISKGYTKEITITVQGIKL